MELSSLFSSPFIILLITLIIISVLKAFSVVYHRYFYWREKDVPYLGSLQFYKTVWKVITRRISFAEYSDYMYNYYPNAKYVGTIDLLTPGILLRDPELIRDITVKEFEHFPDHRVFLNEEVDPLLGKNVFSLHGDRWKEMRNTLSPSFTASKMKIMCNLVSKCALDFADYLADHPEFSSIMDTKEACRRYTTDVIATVAFGINVNSMKERDNEFYTKGVKCTNFSTQWLIILKMLFIRLMPRFAKFLGITVFSSDITEFFKKVVSETIKFREEKGVIRPDMIHLLMQARDKEGPNDMTLDDIVAQAFIFFLAGFDTSATLMCFVIHELAVNPDIQERLREEVEQHFIEGNGELSYESLSKMIYMDMVISEALRKYPPVIFIDRVCVKNCQLPPSQLGHKSVIVEPNNILVIPVYSLHHNPEYFPNPSKFDPERFNEKNKDNILPYTYIPFGNGPRKCIGNRFALMETKFLVAHLLHKFVLKPTEKTVEPVVFDTKQFTLQPVGGFWVGLEKR